MPTGLPVIPCRRVSRGLGSCPIPRSDTGAPMSRSLGRLHWLDSAPATATNSVAPAGHDHRNDACAGDAVAAVPDARCWEHPVRFGAGRKDPREEPARDRPRIRSRRGYVRRLSTAAAASRESAGRCRRRRPRSARWASGRSLWIGHIAATVTASAVAVTVAATTMPSRSAGKEAVRRMARSATAQRNQEATAHNIPRKTKSAASTCCRRSGSGRVIASSPPPPASSARAVRIQAPDVRSFANENR